MSLAAIRLVAHTIKPIKGFDEELLGKREVLLKAAEIAKRNKVFLVFYKGLTKANLEIPEYVNRIAEKEVKRKQLYEKVLMEIAERAEQRDIKFMVFKSIKPFPYVGDDIDFFLLSKNSFNLFIKLLKEINFHLMGYGPSEVTLIRKIHDICVMADVHRAFSASYIPYVSGVKIWERKREYVFGGFKLFIPSLNDDILILTGHSLLKEFRMNLADFYHALFLLPNIDWNGLSKLARIEDMNCALKIFIDVADQMHKILYHSRMPLDFDRLNNSHLSRILHQIIKKSFKDQVCVPYYYPLYLPVIAYLDKLSSSIAKGKESLNLLLSFVKAPFTSKEGLNILWNYITKQIT